MFMKNFIFALLASFCVLTACQNNTNVQNGGDSTGIDTNIVPATQQFCYQSIKNKDTATITLMSSGPITTGELAYNIFEKDRNTGIFEGELHGDTLIAEYTFTSEGRESVRQVAFLKKGDQLLEGYGDAEEKNGKMVFKNTSTLTFGNGIVFNKVDCH